jgi:hypothetical protein
MKNDIINSPLNLVPGKAESAIPEDLQKRHQLLRTLKPLELAVCDIRAEEWIALIERIGKLESDLRLADEALEAQRAKYDDCPHKPTWDMVGCGCSLDKIGDVCGLHAPALRQAQEQNTKLESAARAARDALAGIRNADQSTWDPEYRSAEEFKKWAQSMVLPWLAALDAALGDSQ